MIEVARACATRTAARSAALGVRSPSRAERACSTVAARRSANAHECAEQYAQPAARLAAYIARPTVERAAPSPHVGNGRFRKFGTITS
jgi:hypothetical protein